jgi:hypothetical protein
MKKIIFSFLTILLVIGTVSASAYALFSSTATVSGLTFSTGNANLQISRDNIVWGDSVDLPAAYTDMAPGFFNSEEFYLKNISLSNIGLKITTKLFDNSSVANSSAWNVIGDKIIVEFQKQDGLIWISLASGSLAQWQSTGFDLDSLTLNTSQKYRMLVTIENVGDEDANQTLSDLSFQFLGTQQ